MTYKQSPAAEDSLLRQSAAAFQAELELVAKGG